jgi:hypothetical protein
LNAQYCVINTNNFATPTTTITTRGIPRVDITLWIESALFSVLMVLSGFLSSPDTSLLSLSRMQLQQMRRDVTLNMQEILRHLSFTGLRSCPKAFFANRYQLDLLEMGLEPVSASGTSGCTARTYR